MVSTDQIKDRLKAGIILDGGLASELERRGNDLRDPTLVRPNTADAPDEITAVHRDYFLAGAHCITTASYQATLPGLIAKGLTKDQAVGVLRRSVALARQVLRKSPIKH